MFKFVILSVLFAAALAKPKPSVLAAAPLAVAPAVAPAVVTAQSSQVIARNYNALVAPAVAAAPLVAAPAPLVAGPAPLVAGPAPLVAGPAPLVAGPAPLVAGPAPLAPLAASYRVAAPALASPYWAAPAPLLYG